MNRHPRCLKRGGGDVDGLVGLHHVDGASLEINHRFQVASGEGECALRLGMDWAVVGHHNAGALHGLNRCNSGGRGGEACATERNGDIVGDIARLHFNGLAGGRASVVGAEIHS